MRQSDDYDWPSWCSEDPRHQSSGNSQNERDLIRTQDLLRKDLGYYGWSGAISAIMNNSAVGVAGLTQALSATDTEVEGSSRLPRTEHFYLQEVSSGRMLSLNLPCVLGRSDKADLTFSDPSISYRHALIFETHNQIWIEDLKSSNGVYVNERKIREKTPLHPGDSVQLGQTKFLASPGEKDLSDQTMILHSLDAEAEWKPGHDRLKLIYEIATDLSENQDLAVLGEKIFSRLQRIFNQDRSYLALFQEDGMLKPLFSDSSSEKTPVSQSIINRVFRNAESFLLEDALDDVALKAQESIIALRIRSALCVPLLYQNQIYGLIYLDRNIPGAYRQEDLELLRSISFMLAPLIENARLWSELNNHYTKTVETLKETEAMLISAERTAAYVRLAQAMAHEIRNPLTAIGGLVRMMGRSGADVSENRRFNEVLGLVERVEQVLKEVDSFVRLPLPEKKLERIDLLIQKVIESDTWKVTSEVPKPLLSFNTPQLMVPLDADLFEKALSAMFKEIVLSAPRMSDFEISVHDCGDEVEIVIGEGFNSNRLYELFDPRLQKKPWSLGLFLNITQKIISDHGGKLLVDPEGQSMMPLFIRIPRRAKASERGHEAEDL